MKQILIIDDDLLALWGITRALDNVVSAEIRTATTGDGGIKEISERAYDLCLLDLSLPDSKGLDVLRKIREISPLIKVVVMTSSPLESEISTASACVPYGVLEKPFEASDLKALVKQAIGDAGDRPPRSGAVLRE